MNDSAGSAAANLIPVRMGEMAVSRDERDVFSVIGLGSCVAMVLLAPEQRAAALSHVVLPAVRMATGNEAPPGKFADTAVSEMLRQLRLLGVAVEDTYAMIVGGATMFGNSGKSRLAAVGERNIEAARQQLARHGIGIADEDVGGTIGRSVQLALADLKLFVRTGSGEPRQLEGSPIPLRVKLSQSLSDLQQEPFPDDVWDSDTARSRP